MCDYVCILYYYTYHTCWVIAVFRKTKNIATEPSSRMAGLSHCEGPNFQHYAMHENEKPSGTAHS